jgi:hypothetical protein
MWNSIYLKGVGYGWPNAGIHVENSTISDAEVAIDIGVHNDLYLENSYFIGNFIGVRAVSESDGGVPFVLKFEGVYFITGDDPLPPHANEIMYAGVYLNKVYGFPIGGGPGSSAVTFLKIRNGIVSHASHFTAINCGFFTSLTTGFPTVSNISEDNWNGVLMYNSVALVSDSYFDNNTVGIHAINSPIELTGSYLDETIGYGVYAKGDGNYAGWVTIEDNEFVSFKSAVYLSNLQYTLVKIQNNSIEIREENDLPNTDGLAGILIEGSTFYDPAFPLYTNRRAVIANNTINLRDAQFGVSLIATIGVDVLGSDASPITFMPNNGDFNFNYDLLAGINIQGGGAHTISSNSIIGEGATVTLPGIDNLITGVRVSMSDLNNFCDNTVNDLEVGVRFEGPDMGTRFLNTNFKSHDVALSMDADGVIGPQVGAGNQWNAASLDKGARHENPDPFFSENSQFRVDSYGLPTTPMYPTGIDPDPSTTMANWFYNNGSPAWACVTMGFSPDEDPNSVDDAIAAGTVVSGTTFSNTTKWQLERYLFSKLDRYPAIAQQHPDMAAFGSLNQNTNVGKLHGIQQDIAGLGAVPANEVAQYEENMDSLMSNLSRLADIYESLTNADSSQTALLTAERLVIVQNMKTWENTNDSLRAIIQTHRAGLIQQYLSQNAAVTTTAVYETNERTVNDIFLNTVAQGIYDFTSSQRDSLNAIANQCPKMGGSVVYKARALYQLVEERNYNDQDICFPSHSALVNGTGDDVHTASSSIVSIYPNPADDELVVVLDEKVKADRVEIVSLGGQPVLVRNIGEQLHKVTLPIGGIPVGIYFVELKNGSRRVSIEKLVIQR